MKEKQRPKKIQILCQRCGKEAHILFDASPQFRFVCIACRTEILEARGGQEEPLVEEEREEDSEPKMGID